MHSQCWAESAVSAAEISENGYRLQWNFIDGILDSNIGFVGSPPSFSVKSTGPPLETVPSLPVGFLGLQTNLRIPGGGGLFRERAPVNDSQNDQERSDNLCM